MVLYWWTSCLDTHDLLDCMRFFHPYAHFDTAFAYVHTNADSA